MTHRAPPTTHWESDGQPAGQPPVNSSIGPRYAMSSPCTWYMKMASFVNSPFSSNENVFVSPSYEPVATASYSDSRFASAPSSAIALMIICATSYDSAEYVPGG